MRLLGGIGFALFVGCGGDPFAHTGQSESVEAGIAPDDAGTDGGSTDAPPWCWPLSELQTPCKVDPFAACAARNARPPAAAYACGYLNGAPPGCVGFPICTLVVYCCSATD